MYGEEFCNFDTKRTSGRWQMCDRNYEIKCDLSSSTMRGLGCAMCDSFEKCEIFQEKMCRFEGVEVQRGECKYLREKGSAHGCEVV